MNMPVMTDEAKTKPIEKPGAQLARLREKKGVTVDYVAGKLHLRIKVIELLEADDYDNLPQSVFIKGYIRAYAKLLGVKPEPFLAIFNSEHVVEKKIEKALWQSKRESNRSLMVVRWLTGLVAMGVIVAVSFWWQQSKDMNPSLLINKKSMPVAKKETLKAEPALSHLPTMQSMFNSQSPSEEITSG